MLLMTLITFCLNHRNQLSNMHRLMFHNSYVVIVIRIVSEEENRIVSDDTIHLYIFVQPDCDEPHTPQQRQLEENNKLSHGRAQERCGGAPRPPALDAAFLSRMGMPRSYRPKPHT